MTHYENIKNATMEGMALVLDIVAVAGGSPQYLCGHSGIFRAGGHHIIGREDLRRLMELEGHDQETIDKVLTWYYGTHVDLDALAAALELLKTEMAEAVQRMADLWEQLTAADEAQPLQQPAKLPRPPRCIGPKNKAATRTQRPARVARSSCRKIHK